MIHLSIRALSRFLSFSLSWAGVQEAEHAQGHQAGDPDCWPLPGRGARPGGQHPGPKLAIQSRHLVHNMLLYEACNFDPIVPRFDRIRGIAQMTAWCAVLFVVFSCFV